MSRERVTGRPNSCGWRYRRASPSALQLPQCFCLPQPANGYPDSELQNRADRGPSPDSTLPEPSPDFAWSGKFPPGLTESADPEARLSQDPEKARAPHPPDRNIEGPAPARAPPKYRQALSRAPSSALQPRF